MKNNIVKKQNKSRKGFTLIELLVVVLIIGILAAVAVPQYQKAVEKAKATQAFSVIRTLAAAQEDYYLANGKYAFSFNDLAVDIPWSGTQTWISGNPAFKSNKDWTVEIYNQAAGTGISIGRISGPYAGAGFIYLLKTNSSVGGYPSKQILCMERFVNSAVPFTKEIGSYCHKLFPELFYINIGEPAE